MSSYMFNAVHTSIFSQQTTEQQRRLSFVHLDWLENSYNHLIIYFQQNICGLQKAKARVGWKLYKRFFNIC